MFFYNGEQTDAWEFFLQRGTDRCVEIFFTTGNRPMRGNFFYNGKERKEENGKGTEKIECKTGVLNGMMTEKQLFLYFGLPPDVQKGCPFNYLRVLSLL